MALSAIKTRFENPCNICNRPVKVGWDAYFENDNGKKKLYCKPCGEAEIARRERQGNELQIDDGMAGRIAMLCELIPIIDERLRGIQATLLKLEKIIDTNLK